MLESDFKIRCKRFIECK